jgi:hypothetical protein
MRILIVYIPILVAVLLALVLRRSYGVRVLSAFILGFVASLHFTFLMTAHRLVIEEGVRQSVVTPSSKLPPDFKVAVDSIQRFGQDQMWLFAALVAALIILVLCPFRSVKDQPPK